MVGIHSMNSATFSFTLDSYASLPLSSPRPTELRLTPQSYGTAMPHPDLTRPRSDLSTPRSDLSTPHPSLRLTPLSYVSPRLRHVSPLS
jgi:hypothetical protein